MGRRGQEEKCEEESARTRACRGEQKWRAETGRQRLLIFVTVIKFKVGRRAYVFGTSERKVGSGSAAWSGSISAGILADSVELLSLPLCGRRILEIAIEAGIVSITARTTPIAVYVILVVGCAFCVFVRTCNK